tara:strand:+ start:702 stop:1073 length:372 start_codon:yes stop_codon:yes gene_type:complete
MIYFCSYDIGRGYKDRHPLQERITECKRLKEQYPHRIPVILEFDAILHKQKLKERFLVPKDLTMGQFMFVIRSQLQINPSEAIYLMCRGYCIPNTDIFSEISEKHKEKCGNIFMRLYKENTFG